MDFLPTFLAAAGKTDIKEDLLDGYTSSALGREYKVHLDGYNILPLLTGKIIVKKLGLKQPTFEIFAPTPEFELPPPIKPPPATL